MLKEFKEFAMRGNVLDLAVAVIIGGAFGKIIASLVNDVLMPLVGLVLGGINFSEQAFTVGEAVVKWGAFVNSIIDFVIVAFVIFMIVRAMNRMQRQKVNDFMIGRENVGSVGAIRVCAVSCASSRLTRIPMMVS